MNNYIKTIMVAAAISCVGLSSCKKDFFNRVPEDAITLDNYYQTNEQVANSTNALYNTPWFGWNTKSGWAIGEMASGNGRSYSSDVVNFGNLSVTGDNFELTSAWNSLFTVVAQANALINNLPEKVPATVDPAIVNNALGEAHLMRALAYFHLVRLWGNVPIIENSLDYVDNYQLNTNPVPDVYKFIVNDLLFAEANCKKMIRSGASAAQGHVSSGSASALLAKVYLYMEDYPNALLYANKVINSGEFKLYGADVNGKTFNDLFHTSDNNNEESIIALQWAANGGYGRANAMQASFAYNSQITTTGDGYGVLGPTFDLQDMYEAGDLRRKATIMLPGDHYDDINKSGGGYTLPADANSQGTHAQVKKYVVGSPADNGGIGSAQSTGNNTYMMRYSDVYLIKAEAIVAGAQTSSNPEALAALNKIRNRAGLGNLTTIRRFYQVPNAAYNATTNPNAPTTLTRDDILDERRREFAIEMDFWFDLTRIDGFNASSHPRAITLIKQQDRGTSDNSTPPVRYGNEYRTPTDASFLFPYPSTETAANPLLLQAPVPYNFK
jgi:hypothetical protein